MKRREFLKQSTSSVALLSMAGRGFEASAGAQTTTKIALVKTLDRSKGITAAMTLISIPPIRLPGRLIMTLSGNWSCR
jgi:hypothetical protein